MHALIIVLVVKTNLVVQESVISSVIWHLSLKCHSIKVLQQIGVLRSYMSFSVHNRDTCITLFRSISMFCGTHKIPWNIEYEGGNVEEYLMEYCESRITLLWILP